MSVGTLSGSRPGSLRRSLRCKCLGMNQTRARAVVEVLVEVGRFTNVELFERGVYAVRARVKAPELVEVRCGSASTDTKIVGASAVSSSTGDDAEGTVFDVRECTMMSRFLHGTCQLAFGLHCKLIL